MECTLATLAACFSLSNVYLDGHVSVIDQAITHYHFNGAQWSIDREYQNPYGGFAVGFSVPFDRVTFSLEASHMMSSIGHKDEGINAISLRARWFPFRR